MPGGCVIVGGGHGGFHTANALRDAGYDKAVTIIEAASRLPYERPPLSKSYLLGRMSAEDLLFRPLSFYGQKDISVLTDTRVVDIDIALRSIALEPGGTAGYDDLVLATGSRPRTLVVPGSNLAGVHRLATIEDADRLAVELSCARHLVVVGAGFIGLEAAAVATEAGVSVTVLNLSDRPLGRAASAPLAVWLQAWHEERGVIFIHGTAPVEFLGANGRVTAVRDSRGRIHSADLVVVGIGATPATELAERAGLPVDGGIAVDKNLRAADHVYAIGDCARYPHALLGQTVRLESVQNATDHARTVASALTGESRPYAAVPWFWSDQGQLKIQIAGLTGTSTQHHLRGDISGGRFSVCCYSDDGTFLGVDSVGRAADHVAARRMLASGSYLAPKQVVT